MLVATQAHHISSFFMVCIYNTLPYITTLMRNFVDGNGRPMNVALAAAATVSNDTQKL